MSASALAQTPSELFARASEAFEQADFEAALADFEAAREAGMSGAAIDYNIAVCRYRLGQWAAAEADFALLAFTYPNMSALASYNRGLALAKLGRDEAAREALAAALRGGDERLTALADAMLARLGDEAPAGPAVSWLKYLDLGLGHDDNVALIDEASLPAGPSPESPFTELYGQLSGPLPRDSDWRLDASLYSARYADTSEFDQTVLQVGARREWRPGAWRLDAGPYVSHSTLDGDGFEQRFGGTLTIRRALGSASEVMLALRREDIDAGDERFDFVDGRRATLRLRYERRGGIGRWRADLDHEQNERAAPGVSPTRNRLSVSYRRPLTELWAGELRYAHRKSRYEDLVVPRDETLGTFGLSVGRDLPGRWQALLRYERSRNRSDDERFEYSRQRLTLSFGKLF